MSVCELGGLLLYAV